VVASKLILILDDLLWVLTDSQLKAMVQYAKSLSEAMEMSAQQRKSMAAEEQVHMPMPKSPSLIVCPRLYGNHVRPSLCDSSDATWRLSADTAFCLFVDVCVFQHFRGKKPLEHKHSLNVLAYIDRPHKFTPIQLALANIYVLVSYAIYWEN